MNIKRASYDKSTKQFEILCKEYWWYKYERKIAEKPEWKHYRYYNTMEAAMDAIRDIRHRILDVAYRDYPGKDLEVKYPHLKPIITIRRYRINERVN